MQLPTLHPQFSKHPDQVISTNEFRKMDISMVLNHSLVEEESEQELDVEMETSDTSEPWKPTLTFRLPSIQTLQPIPLYECEDYQSHPTSHQDALNAFSFKEHEESQIPMARIISPKSEVICLLPSLESLSLHPQYPPHHQRFTDHDHQQAFTCQARTCACQDAETRIVTGPNRSSQRPIDGHRLPPLKEVVSQALSPHQSRIAASRQPGRTSDPRSPGSSRPHHKHSPNRDARNSHVSIRHQSAPNAVVKRGLSHHSSQVSRSISVKAAHSNKPYEFEQVLFIKYMKEDCKISYNDNKEAFQKLFPGVIRESDQCMSSRLYRANRIPLLDENNQLMFDDKGKLLTEKHKVRFRHTPEGKAKGVPITLVDSYPHLAIGFSWVSEEHKLIAELILQGNDPNDNTGSKTHTDPSVQLIDADGHYRACVLARDPSYCRAVYGKVVVYLC
jgi:hypothetical protein